MSDERGLLKNSHEKIIKRDDGSRIKIIVRIEGYSYGIVSYNVDVERCKPKKRTWENVFLRTDRRPDREGRLLGIVSSDELHQAKKELWLSLEPK